MSHALFIEIDKFDQWARQEFSLPQDELAGEWECDYLGWTAIYNTFEDFIKNTDPKQWTAEEKAKLLYIIARDNECEILAQTLAENESALTILTHEAIDNGPADAKWQLAIQLNHLEDKMMAATLLEQLVNDDEEYVNRRALMELAKIQPDKIEYYCEKFWNKDKYGDNEEYQRIAVLEALSTIQSKQLRKYIELAKQDGRKYLVQYADRLEKEN